MTTTLDSRTEGLWRQARAQAATLGAFDPSRLLDPEREDQLAALDRLAGECVEVMDQAQPRWMLHPDVRAQALREMEQGDLAEAMRAVQPAPDDHLGRLLRDVLHGKELTDAALRKLPMQELGLLRTALHLASATRDTAQALRQVDRMLTLRDADDAMRSLLPHRLVGRNSKLARLRWFVQQPPVNSAEDILWVTGAGGAGKSALLARFADALRKAGTAVLQVDFDRPGLSSGSLVTLMMEVSRQLEIFFPELAGSLSEYRRRVRAGRSPSQQFATFEERQIDAHRSYSAWHECMQAHLPLRQDIVLILDTAEEVGLSSDFDLAALRRWLRELRTRDGLPQLKTILCGRAFEEDQLLLVPKSHRLPLDDLAPAASVELLMMYLGDAPAARELPLDALVDMLGGNPLMLKILAAYLRKGGVAAANELLQDPTQVQREFAQAFLYRRILDRLHEDSQKLRDLAHPGLVLRRVTPHLIQHVLAGPCRLGPVDEPRARELFQRLAGQVWLVQRTTNPDVVIHRRDLRRLMLQAMTAQDETVALEIHAAVSAYYRDSRDPVLTPQEQQVEAQYHALFMPGAPPPDRESLSAFARALGEDLDSLPVPARARIKLELGRKLTQTETRALSGNEQAFYESERVRKEVRISGVLTRPAGAPAPRAQDGGDMRVEVSQVHAAFEQGDLEQVARGTKSAVAQFAGVAASPKPNSSPLDFTQSAVWRCAIATLAHDPDPLLAALRESADPLRASRGWESHSSGPWLGRLLPSHACEMLFRVHGADCPPDLAATPPASPALPRLMTAEDLRYFQLRDKRPGERAEVQLPLLRDMAPGFSDIGKSEQALQLDAGAARALAALADFRAKAAKVTLNDLERFSGWEGFVMVLDPTLLRGADREILVGRMPEVYPLVRSAARACTDRFLVDFTTRASRDQPLWPSELAPAHLAGVLEVSREEWTATLISCIDRFGLLRQFIDWIEDRNRVSARNRQLLRTVRDYEQRLKQFI